MFEHFFQCPYCWEEISVLLDPSVSSQTYIEDCENCCNPIEIRVSFENGELTSYEAVNIEQ
ncbi:CPXCG motif-containing cysteine-rich protein [Salegentibacter agarivorans]|jgi:transcription elongation factor Elf1|uniref:CPXCG motif-containing cysteine-rich protein n=1 Tax=unclassified Salegentibacter TaxID=2633436 RepID=UPI00094ADDEA|nr:MULTISPECIES: CPXCG motif-containing cysteine-rich protein [unclassified Salegentibacter]MBO2544025.1 CPXCG motif-containing cysteine-rich protein [Salegentibacter sp. BDJ18]